MALFTFLEILDILIMTAAVAYIFYSPSQTPRGADYDPLVHYKHGFDWEAFKFAMLVSSLTIVLHEFGHKFVAMSFGVDATFHAAYTWLALGIVLKLMSLPFIFLVPAFVSFTSVGPFQDSLIALSGPLVNLALWLVPLFIYNKKLLNKKYNTFLLLTSKLNMTFFIFNMLPIPGFDGFSFYSGIINSIL